MDLFLFLPDGARATVSSARPRYWLRREKGCEIHGQGAALAQARTLNDRKRRNAEWPSVRRNARPPFTATPAQHHNAGEGLATAKIKGQDSERRV